MSGHEALSHGPDHTLLAFLEDPVVVLSRKGRVVYINPAFQRRFGASRAGAFGKDLAAVLPPRMAEPLLEHLRQLEPGDPPRHFWIGAERERHRVSMGVIALNGAPAGAVATLGEAPLESALKQQNLDLFRALVDDLRLPMAEIVSLCDQPRAFADTIKHSARAQTEQLTESLSRLHDFGEVLFGDIRPEQAPFYPNRLVALVRKSLRPLSQQRGVYLEDGSARELPRLLGDPALTNRLLGLLVDYMIKSVPKNEMVIVSVELLLMPSGQPRLDYAITGTGIISMESELMEGELPLASVFSGLSDEKKRLILRLLLARRLVSAMNGTVTVAAHEAAGTTLSIQTPVQIHFSK